MDNQEQFKEALGMLLAAAKDAWRRSAGGAAFPDVFGVAVYRGTEKSDLQLSGTESDPGRGT